MEPVGSTRFTGIMKVSFDDPRVVLQEHVQLGAEMEDSMHCDEEQPRHVRLLSTVLLPEQ